ncbi:MAG: SLC13 family permease [Candidatus Hydrothermarchaeales archaeon]
MDGSLSLYDFIKKRRGLILSGIVALAILLAPTPEPVKLAGETIVLTPHGQQMLALLAAFVVIFITEALPFGMTVAVVYVWIVAFGVLPYEEAAVIFSHDAAWFIMGALMIAVVLIKYDIHMRILAVILRIVGSSTQNVVLGIVAFSALASVFIADHTVAALMLPVGVAVVQINGGIEEVPNLAKLLMFSIAFGATVGGLSSPSGGGRNVLMIGFLNEFFNVRVGYGHWMVMALPITFVMIPILAYYLPRIFKPEVEDLSEAANRIQRELERNKMGRKDWIVTIIFLITLFLWITRSHIYGIGTIAMFGTLLYIFFGLVDWEDLSKIHWGVVLLYFGVIGLGKALIDTGASKWLASKALQIISSFGIGSGYPLVFGSATFMSLVTQTMSDGPAVATMGPTFLELARIAGTDPIILGISLAISSAFSFILVIGTPPNAIIYGSGYVNSKDFRKAGILLEIIALALLFLIIYFWWGFLGVGIMGFH